MLARITNQNEIFALFRGGCVDCWSGVLSGLCSASLENIVWNSAHSLPFTATYLPMPGDVDVLPVTLCSSCQETEWEWLLPVWPWVPVAAMMSSKSPCSIPVGFPWSQLQPCDVSPCQASKLHLNPWWCQIKWLQAERGCSLRDLPYSIGQACCLKHNLKANSCLFQSWPNFLVF